MTLKSEFHLLVLGPIFIAVAFLLIQSSVLIGSLEEKVLSLMKEYLQQMGIDYINQKNQIYQTVLEYQYTKSMTEISIMNVLIKLQFNSKLKHTVWDDKDIFDSKAIRLDKRQSISANSDKSYYIYYSPNIIIQQDIDQWPPAETSFFDNYMYLLDVVPRAYPSKSFLAIDPSNGLTILYPLSSQIPNYEEGSNTYSPQSQSFSINSIKFKDRGIGQYSFNQPQWIKDSSFIPLCAITEEDSTKKNLAISCLDIAFDEQMKYLKYGIIEENNSLKNVYSYLIHPITREVIAISEYSLTQLMTIDVFEFGEDYDHQKGYENFKADTSFINGDILIESNKKRCKYNALKYSDESHTISFIDEDNASYLLVMRTINICQKNNLGSFNLIRVAYIGTAINLTYLHEFVVQKSMAVSIIKEISIIVNTIIICGVCISVAFLGFQFSERIFAPINNLAQGINLLESMKRVDVDTIKILHKEVMKLPKELIKNQESLEPLLAYHNLLFLVSEANQLYKSNKPEEALKLFEVSSQIYSYLGNEEGRSICTHNQGVILVEQNKLTEGIALIEQSVESCIRERNGFLRRCLSQGIQEQEILTDERYFHTVITLCRRSFSLLQAHMLLIRQFQQQDRTKKVKASKLIDIVLKVIEIQQSLKEFGKISSVLIYSQILLSYYYYLSNDIEQSLNAYNQAEQMHTLYLPKLLSNPINSYSASILHQLLLVQKGLIEEKRGNYQQAALLFTLSIEESEEYQPNGRKEALLGLQRIFEKYVLRSSNLDVMIKSYDKHAKEVYFLIDLSIEQNALNGVSELREIIANQLCNENDKISQLTFSSNKLNISYFQLNTSDTYLRNIHIESDPEGTNFPCLQQALCSFVNKVQEAKEQNMEQQSDEQIRQLRKTIVLRKSIDWSNKNRRCVTITSNPTLSSQQNFQENQSPINYRYSEANQNNQSINISAFIDRQNKPTKVLFIFADLSKNLLSQLTEAELSSLSKEYLVIMVDLSTEQLNPNSMFNKILLSENINQYHYFNYSSISNRLISQWKYLFQEASPNFKFQMEYFQ